MANQKTISRAVSLKGTGLHTAHLSTVKFKPAPVDSGLVFVRTDLPGKPEIKAAVECLLPEEKRIRRTSIGRNGVELHTVEHVLATVVGLEIDNLRVEIDNDEFPGSDGSSKELAELLLKAGIQDQPSSRRYLSLKEPVFVGDNGSQVIALPSPSFRISYTLDYPPPLNSQFASFVIDPRLFLEEVAPARTFCMHEEVDLLLKQGLGKGSNHENTLVFRRDGVIKNRLRFENEMVRHKILDLLGDIGLLGVVPRMHIIAIRSGHNLNMRLVAKLYELDRRATAAAVIPPTEELDPNQTSLEARDILKIIPHRPPFVFVDRILSIEEDRHLIVGLKNVSIDEPYFAGHFPGRPVMPGVLVVEAMAQVAGVLMLRRQENRDKVAYFAAIDKVRFRNAVLPGDQLRIEVELVKMRSRVGQVHARALVGSKLAVEADLMFALVDR